LAIEEGLGQAWSLGYKKILCEVDCSEAMSLLSSDSDITRHQLKTTISRIRNFLQRNWVVSFACIPRDINQVVDCLAKYGAHDRIPLRIWKYPPSWLIPVLCRELA
jgi:hypothetical protein